MDFPLADNRSAHTHLARLTNHNHIAPNNRFITRRVGQLGYSPLTGQWHTSTLDWCEANYDISIILARSWGLSIWLAEWWNCWSNIPFVLLALWGVYSTRQLPNRARYALAHLAIAGVGVGSFVFHATLNWYAQVLLDELPMIYATCQALYCVLAEGRPTGSTRHKAFCIAFPTLITLTYLAYPNPLFHQIAFGLLSSLVAYRIYFLLKRLPPKRQPINGEKVNTLRRDADRLLVEGIGLTVVAFAIWNLDNVYCDGITMWRKDERVPYWLGALSQGHAWWHILTALGVNRSLTACIGVTIGVQDPDSYEFAYRLKFFPYVRPRHHHGTQLKAEQIKTRSTTG